MYLPSEQRYDSMRYNRCGRSGVKLPAVSLGLWHNFGGGDPREGCRAMLRRAFDLGITHIDLANNYGPPPGSAEETFGWALERDFRPYRDELILSTKAGWGMWPGPYGDFGSRKYLVASLDQSLMRMGLEYVDIFYHHRPDPETPLEETMGALDHIVRSGKALYAGVSNYPAERLREAARIMNRLGTPLLIHQPKYSMFHRVPEESLFGALADVGAGCIVYSPLAQGLLTDKYLDAIPPDSRVMKSGVFLHKEDVTEARRGKLRALNQLAGARGQKLSQMAVAWVLRRPEVTSALIGASKPAQIEEAAAALAAPAFSAAELAQIDTILAGERFG
jgi:L-glyceraldehyde 3-phosphate reductase